MPKENEEQQEQAPEVTIEEPETGAEAKESSEAAPEEEDWGSLAVGEDKVEESQEEVAETPAAESEEGGEEAAAQETPPKEEAAEAEETPPADAQVEQEAGEETPPASAAEETPGEDVPQPTAEEQEQARTAARDKVMSELETSYGITKEEGEALLADPEAEVPKLAARIHMNVVEATLSVLSRQLPHAVAGINKATTSQQKAQDAFYEQWPKLNDPKFAASITRQAQAYRAQNPDATQEQVNAEVGGAVMFAHRIPFDDETPPAETMETPQHKPAGPGGGPVPKQTKPKNDFEDIVEEFEADDAR